MTPSHSFPLLAALGLFLAVSGCGGENPPAGPGSKTGSKTSASTKTNGGSSWLTTSKTNTKPEALNRDNFLRLDLEFAEAELAKLFGPPQEAFPNSDERQYIWTSGKTKLDVRVKNGKVVSAFNPVLEEARTRRTKSFFAARAILDTLRKHVLKNKNRFPTRLDDLDLTGHGSDTIEVLKRGDVAVPWGKSANRLVWTTWKETAQHGGFFFRFDDKEFQRVRPKEFARLDATILTSDTIPAEILAAGKPGPGEPTTLDGLVKVGTNAQGFFTAGVLRPLIQTNPGSLDEVAKHMVRNYWDVQVLRALEKGYLVVRWGRDPKQGVYAYPKGFPGALEEQRWAIYKGQLSSFQTVEEAKKAFDE